jgi:RimJ/RimL family protein N-acetyltransferase
MENYRFYRAALHDLESLRQQQTFDLKGQVHDPLEERIELAEPNCLKIRLAGRDVGYALLDYKWKIRITLLEYYLVPSCRRDAKLVLGELIRKFHCGYWFVNSQDSFALPLLLECRWPYELDGYLFSVERPTSAEGKNTEMIGIARAIPDDLESTYRLIRQDGFYTGNGRKALAIRIRNAEIYLLRSNGEPIGVGFVSPLARTPSYADIAMIIDNKHRGKGFGFQLVRQLIQISLEKGLIPTALTSPQNIASRRTLEKCGFHLDGCVLLANTGKF